MKQIELTQGKFTQVDDENFIHLNQFKWYAEKKSNSFYARRSFATESGRQKKVYMHVEIMDFKGIDHIDHDGLNNQKSNLRQATTQQNGGNRKKSKNCSSNYKGVSWDKQNKKWQTLIKYNNQAIFLGRFNNEIDAAKAYNEAAIEYFKEFANLNKI